MVVSHLNRLIPGLVSVIVPVYNIEEFLTECLNSILSQTYQNIEVICIDDGSTDGSAKILAKLAVRDARIMVIHQTNHGLARTRDQGILHAHGEWLAFVDSDDAVAPNMVGSLVDEAVRTNADIVCFGGMEMPISENQTKRVGVNMNWVPSQIPFNHTDVPNTLFFVASPAVQFRFFKHSFLREIGLIFGDLRYAEDVPFSMTAMAAADKISIVNQPLYYYRRGREGSLSTNSQFRSFPISRAHTNLWANLISLGLADQLRLSFHNLVISNLDYELHKPQTLTAKLELLNWLNRGGLNSIGMSHVDPSMLASQLNRDRWMGLCELLAQARNLNETLVSIIMPVHNRQEYVDQAITSVRCQSHSNLEIILVDDGSTDGASDILAIHAGQDSRVRVITQSCSGAGRARNVGLAAASGAYCMFLDSDDWFDVDMVQDLLWKAISCESDITVCEARAWSETQQRYLWDYPIKLPKVVSAECFCVADIPGDIFRFCASAVWVKLYRSDFLRKFGLEFQELPNSNDVYFNLLTLALASRITIVKKSLVTYRRDTGSSLQDNKGSNHATHWLTALHATKNALQTNGLWDQVREAFCEQVIIHAEFNFRTVLDREAAHKLWQATRGATFQRLGFGPQQHTLVLSPTLCRFFTLMRYQDFEGIFEWFDHKRPIGMEEQKRLRRLRRGRHP